MSRSLVLERTYDSPPADVFKAWTDIDLLSRWFGCGPDMLWQVHEWDAQVGGKLRVSLDFDGDPFEMTGEFLVVDPPNRLQYRWGESETITVDIAAGPTGSLLTLTHAGLPTDEQHSIVTGGWTNSLGQLGEALSSTASAGQK